MEQATANLPEPVEPGPGGASRRRRSWRFWLAVAVVLAIAAVAVAVATDGSLGKTPGTTRLAGGAKTFTLPEVRDGRPQVSLRALRGKPVVLNFFGSWCGPCIREMPGFQAVWERYKRRVHFVGVTFNDTRDGARGVVAKTGVTYLAAYDATNDVALKYGLRVMPTTVFISPEGNLVERKDGELSEVQLRATLDRLFPAP